VVEVTLVLALQAAAAAGKLVDAGVVLSHQGRFTEAGEQFVRALALDARHGEAHYLLGLVREQAGDRASARESYTAAAKFRPGFGEPLARLCELDAAQAQTNESGYEAALALCRRASALLPRDAEPHFQAGWLLGQLGNQAGAIGELRAALALDPALPNLRFELALAYAAAQSFAQAATLLKQVVAAEPQNGKAKFQLGSVLAKQGDCAGALPLLERAAEGAQQHVLLATCLKKLGREDEAAAEFARARAAREGAEARMQAKYRAAIARKQAEAGQLRAAAEEYRAALTLTPDDATLKIDLAVALLKLGDRAAVRALLAGERDPLARYQLALAAEEPRAAAALLEEIVRERPAFAEAWYQLGVISAGLGDASGAEAALAEATRLRPDRPAFRAAWAEALAQAGRSKDAAEQRRLAGAVK